MLIQNAKIYTMGKNDILNADILIRNGKIAKIEPNIDPANELCFDANGCSIMPGIIDASSQLGLHASGMRWEGNESNEKSENNLSHLCAHDGFHPLDESIIQARKGGITTAILTSGEQSVIGAKSSAVKTTGESLEHSLLKEYCDLPVTFGNHPKRLNDRGEFPRSRMGIASILRSALLEAESYAKSQKENGLDETKYSPIHEAMLKVLNGTVPIKLCAYKAQDILAAIRLQKEFGFKMILNQCTEAYAVLDEINEAALPLIVGNYLIPVSDYEELGRRMDMPVQLEKAGLDFAISTHVPDIGYSFMPANAALLVKHGLSEEKAMRTLTIDAAKILGLDERIGSLEEGKDADLLLLDGAPLYSMTNIIKTMINGKWID